MLSDKLGAYLDGLDKTDIKFTLSDAILEMENVSFKEEALKNIKLPIQIKHGLIRKLDVFSKNLFHLCVVFIGKSAVAYHIIVASLNHIRGYRPISYP